MSRCVACGTPFVIQLDTMGGSVRRYCPFCYGLECGAAAAFGLLGMAWELHFRFACPWCTRPRSESNASCDCGYDGGCGYDEALEKRGTP